MVYVSKPVLDELDKIKKSEGLNTRAEQFRRMTEFSMLGKNMRTFVALDMRKRNARGKLNR